MVEDAASGGVVGGLDSITEGEAGGAFIRVKQK